MDGLRLAAAIRGVRLRRRMRQEDIAERAGVGRATVSRLERGHVDALTLGTIQRICDVLDIRVVLYPRWRGGDLDRMLSAGHAAMHEQIARWFRRRWPDWTTAPEISFAYYGERGVIDVLAWHAESRTLLVIELKTELVDLNETVGTLDRKRRLAERVARDRGWQPEAIGVWLVVATGRTNHRRIAEHATFLRNAYPANGQALRRWLAQPSGPIAALSVESFGAGQRRRIAPKRVRRSAGT